MSSKYLNGGSLTGPLLSQNYSNLNRYLELYDSDYSMVNCTPLVENALFEEKTLYREQLHWQKH